MNLRTNEWYQKVSEEVVAELEKIDDVCRNLFQWQEYNYAEYPAMFDSIKSLNPIITNIERDNTKNHANQKLTLTEMIRIINIEIADTLTTKVPQIYHEPLNRDYSYWIERIKLKEKITQIYTSDATELEKLQCLLLAIEQQFLEIVNPLLGDIKKQFPDVNPVNKFIENINSFPNVYGRQLFMYLRYLAELLRNFYEQHSDLMNGYVVPNIIMATVHRIISPQKRQFFPSRMNEPVEGYKKLLTEASKKDDKQIQKMVEVLHASASNMDFKPITQPIRTEWRVPDKLPAQLEEKLNTPTVTQQCEQQAILDYYAEAREKNLYRDLPDSPTVTQQCEQQAILSYSAETRKEDPLHVTPPSVAHVTNGFVVGRIDDPSPRPALFCSDLAFGMPPAYFNSLDAYDFSKKQILASGLDKLGGSYRVENCTLFGVPVKQALPDQRNSDENRLQLSKDEFERFHQIEIAMPDFRQEGKDVNPKYNRESSDYYECNPNDYLNRMIGAVHSQCQHALKNSNTLIAGAQACEVLQNDPYLVAIIYMAIFQHADYRDLKIRFAITNPELSTKFEFVFNNFSLWWDSPLVQHIVQLCQGKSGNPEYAYHTLSELQSDLKNIIEEKISPEEINYLDLGIERLLYRALAPNVLDSLRKEHQDPRHTAINSHKKAFMAQKEELIRTLKLSKYGLKTQEQAELELFINQLQADTSMEDNNAKIYQELEKRLTTQNELLDQLYLLQRMNKLIKRRIQEDIAANVQSCPLSAKEYQDLRADFTEWLQLQERQDLILVGSYRDLPGVADAAISLLGSLHAPFDQYRLACRNGDPLKKTNLHNYLTKIHSERIKNERFDRDTQEYKNDLADSLLVRFLNDMLSKTHTLANYQMGSDNFKIFIDNQWKENRGKEDSGPLLSPIISQWKKDQLIVVGPIDGLAREIELGLGEFRRQGTEVTSINSFFLLLSDANIGYNYRSQGGHYTSARITIDHNAQPQPTIHIDYVNSSCENPLQPPPSPLVAEIDKLKTKIPAFKNYKIDTVPNNNGFKLIPNQKVGDSYSCGYLSLCQISYWLNQQDPSIKMLADPDALNSNKYNQAAVAQLIQDVQKEILINTPFSGEIIKQYQNMTTVNNKVYSLFKKVSENVFRLEEHIVNEFYESRRLIKTNHVAQPKPTAQPTDTAKSHSKPAGFSLFGGMMTNGTRKGKRNGKSAHTKGTKRNAVDETETLVNNPVIPQPQQVTPLQPTNPPQNGSATVEIQPPPPLPIQVPTVRETSVDDVNPTANGSQTQVQPQQNNENTNVVPITINPNPESLVISQLQHESQPTTITQNENGSAIVEIQPPPPPPTSVPNVREISVGDANNNTMAQGQPNIIPIQAPNNNAVAIVINPNLITDIMGYFASLSGDEKSLPLFMELVAACTDKMSNDSTVTDQAFLQSLADICKTNKYIKYQMAQPSAGGLLFRALAQSQRNIAHPWGGSEIKNLSELLIAQQKREFITNELVWENYWMRRKATQCLIDAIYTSQTNVNLSSILAENSEQMKKSIVYQKENTKTSYVIDSGHIKGVTIQEALSCNKLNKSRDRLISLNPKTLLRKFNPSYAQDKSTAGFSTHHLQPIYIQLKGLKDKGKFAKLLNEIDKLAPSNDRAIDAIHIVQEAFLYEARQQGGLVKLLEKLDATPNSSFTYVGGLRALLTTLYKAFPRYPSPLKQLLPPHSLRALLYKLNPAQNMQVPVDNYKNHTWLLQTVANIIFHNNDVDIKQALEHYALVEATINDTRFWSSFTANKNTVTMGELLDHIDNRSRKHLYRQDYLQTIEKNPYINKLDMSKAENGYEQLKEHYHRRTHNFKMDNTHLVGNDKKRGYTMEVETSHYLHALNYLMMVQLHNPTTKASFNGKECLSILNHVWTIYRAFNASIGKVAKHDSILTDLEIWKAKHIKTDDENFELYQTLIKKVEKNRDPILKQALVFAVKCVNNDDPIFVDDLADAIGESTPRIIAETTKKHRPFAWFENKFNQVWSVKKQATSEEQTLKIKAQLETFFAGTNLLIRMQEPTNDLNTVNFSPILN